MFQPTRSHRILSTIALSIFATLPAAAQTINESRRVNASDAQIGDEFGSSVATKNGIVAVGATAADGKELGAGAAYLFDASGTQIHKLIASDGGQIDKFGNAIALNESVVAVGSYNFGGGVYVFDIFTGEQLHKLEPPVTDSSAFFGVSVAIDNNIIAVGAYGNDNGGLSGSAYLFDASTGAQLFKLLPADGAADDLFATSIAISNGIIAVGTHQDDDNGNNSGSAYLFDATTGTQLLKLLPNDGTAEDEFGISIAIDNGIVAVGAQNDADNGVYSGSVYLFDATTGTQLVKLLPVDGSEGDQFGHSISMSDGVIAIGAINDDQNGFRAGSAYIFDATTYLQIAKLLPSDAGSRDEFSNSIAIDQGDIVAGSIGSDSDSTYIFHALPSTDEDIKITATDGAPNDLFSRSIAIDNTTIAVGARGDDDNGNNSGSAYSSTPPPEPNSPNSSQQTEHKATSSESPSPYQTP